MPAEVKGIECPEGQWTPLSTGKANVLAVVRNLGNGRVVLASSIPTGDAPETDYLTLNETRPISLRFADTSTNVYVWPVSKLVVEVVRE